ncbi:MAG: hypothetical protein WAN78_04705, partial [Methanoregula sp.]
ATRRARGGGGGECSFGHGGLHSNAGLWNLFNNIFSSYKSIHFIMTIQPSDWGIALIVAGGSTIGGFIGGILAGIAVEIEKIESTYVDKFILGKRLKKMFLTYFAGLLIVCLIVIISGFIFLRM